MTISGISFYSALLIVKEIGEIGRFDDSASVVAYAGPVPFTHTSGGNTYHGPISKTGSSYFRRILAQCTRVHM